MACFRPNAGPPRSRKVVKPRISVRSASAAAASRMYPTSAASRAEIGRPANIVCQCASIMPGMSVRPPQSMTRDPAGGVKSSVGSAFIRPASTSRRRPPCSALDLPSKRRKFEKRTGGAAPLRPRARRKAERGERGAHARNEASPREFAVNASRDRADLGRAAATAVVRAGSVFLSLGVQQNMSTSRRSTS
jgi:hypothetical protein